MVSYKRWDREEDNFLIENYSSMLVKDISKYLNRSRKAIQRRAHRLGISNKTPVLDISKVRDSFSKKGFHLISNEYINSYQKLLFKCPQGHVAEITWNKFKNGRGCPKCYYNTEEMYDKVFNVFSNLGYRLLTSKSDYINSKQKLLFTCPNGHKHSICWNSFEQGQRCGKCNPNVSEAEKEIARCIKEMGFSVVENSKKVIEGKEIDIYVPGRKLAIEYCGLRWHGESFSGRSRSYHYDKMTACLNKGIRLITVFEDEYLNRPAVVIGRIKAALGEADSIVYARKTKFCQISLDEARVFLNKYHLQGYSPCKYRFGLFANDRLVQVMTFGCVSRKHAGGDDTLEMKRLASLPNIIVVGGANKLFCNSLPYFKRCTKVKSYCDMRWANPERNVYEILGFTFEGETKYTPHYFKGQKRYRNHTLRKTLEERKTGKTEWEIRREQGYDRIWDCGHRTYVYKIKGDL